MSAWTPAREADLTTRWGKESVRAIAEAMQTSIGSIYRQARKIGLQPTWARRVPPPLSDRHSAIKGAMPRHRKRIVTAETSPGLFVHGRMNRKIGGVVTKGRWKGMPIYTLTLAERMTCPSSCQMWAACYGNNLNWPRRHLLDRALIERMRWELTGLAARYPAGFVVRIHILGDFGSDADLSLAVEYANAWRGWMEKFPGLRVFGFTAWEPTSEVGKVVNGANQQFPDRWRVRFSGHVLGGLGAVVVDQPEDSRHVLCPFETGKATDCGACGLCWTMDRTVEFVRH